ncbi:hypothetical protein TrVE_jg11966 [Triparma verrucosa]|uniref:C2 domain-containing protein n=1 Tax=Triparma verrucosa TaxID=1606542 RepID=A0A9W7CB33_9STRA|nr:hypothetical protein TrVE_jg11966 [Triparma verrucosa]
MDLGLGGRHNGGGLVIKLLEAKNLKQSDGFGAAGGESDPYVKIRVGDSEATSNYVSNENDPDWKGEALSLDFRRSGEVGWIELWDHDSGMEFDDDILVSSVKFHVPYCSMNNLQEARPNKACPDLAPGVPCSIFTSSFANPVRRICNETAWVNLEKDNEDSDSSRCESDPSMPCLRVLFELEPFTVEVEEQYGTGVKFGAAVDRYDGWWSAMKDINPHLQYYGELNTDADTTYTGAALNQRNDGREELEGSLVMMTPESAKDLPYDETFVRLSINYDATFYVCRESTQDTHLGSLKWMTDLNYEIASFVTLEDFRTESGTPDAKTERRCYYHKYHATTKNKYGFATDNVITLGGNLPKATIESGSNLRPKRMYTVFIIPDVGPRAVPEDLSFDYSLELDISSFILLGVMFLFSFLVMENHLNKNLNFRLDRMPTFLVTRTMTGGDKNVLALLFEGYMLTENNVEFRRHLYWAEVCMKISMSTPLVLLWAWGLATSASGNPPAVGFAILFIGTAFLLVWYGFKLWTVNQWRMSSITLSCLCLSFLCVLSYAIATAFVDPAVYLGGLSVNFVAISVVFGTVNVIPLLAMAFLNDSKLRRSAKQLLAVLDASAGRMPGTKNAVAWHGKGSAFNKLLGNVWSVFDSVSAPVVGPKSQLQQPESQSNEEDKNGAANMFNVGADVTKSSFLASPARRAILNRTFYKASIAILLVYVAIAFAFTDSPTLAVLNTVSLILVDGIHVSLSHGNTDWTPGYQSFLLCASRLFITSAGRDNWLAGYSATYFLYGVALSREVVRKSLPTLSEQVASGVAYYGYEAFPKFKGDVSGSPGFCLGLMSFLFVLLMAFCAYGTLSDLPMLDIEVGGLCTNPWPSYVFGGLAFLFVLIFCLAIATRDAAFLASRHLLAGEKGKSYLWSKSIRLPIIFGLMTEITVVVTGLFVYASTKCTSVFTLSVFMPFIVAAGGYVYSVWKANDYEVVVWPPAPPDFDVSTEEDEDAMVANMLGDMFGGGNDDMDKDMFKLPPLMKTGSEIRKEVKMPPMPLKSALKHKQQQELKQAKEAEKNQNNPQQPKVDGDGIETISLGTAGDSLMEFDENSISSQVIEAGNDNDDEEDKTLKLPEVRNKFKHQRFKLLDYLYSITQSYFFLKPFGFVGAKVMKVWRMTPCGKPKKEVKKVKKEGSAADGQGITDSIGQEEVQNLDVLLGNAPSAADVIVYEEVNFEEMSLLSAALGGYLLTEEYYALFGTFAFFGLIFLQGLIISLSDNLGYVGHLVWVVMYVAVFTASAFVKFFSTFGNVREDRSLMVSMMMAGLVLVGFCFLVFFLELEADPNAIGGLVLLNVLILYPIIVASFVQFWKWKDNGWVINNVDEDGDGRMSCKEVVTYFGIGPIAVAFFFIGTLELFFFNDVYLATSVLLLLGAGLIGVLFLRDWAINDFWLSAKYQSRADWLINGAQVAAFCGAILLGQDSRMYCLSLFFLFYMVECASQVLAWYVTMEKEEPIYFSPFLLPCYSFSAALDDIKEETNNVIWFFKLLGAGCAWGVTLAMFVSPLSYGVVITCVFLLAIVVCIAACLGHVPLQLGQTSKYVSKQDVVESALVARAKFSDRQKPIEIFNAEWQGKTFAKNEWDDDNETADSKLFDEEAYNLATMIEANVKSCRYVEEKKGKRRVNLDGEDGESYFGEEGSLDSRSTVKKKESVPPRADGLMTWEDAFAESIITGTGPLGFVGFFGLWYKIFFVCSNQKFCYHSKIIAKYDSKGARKTVAKSEGSIDCKKIIKELPDLDHALDKRYGEEMRAVVHFMLMLVNSCDARLKHQKVNFQKFLRENRFKLLSNGIKPPKDVYSGGGNGKSGFDVALVATWLSSLTPEERERFHMLRNAFNLELNAREKESDRLDEQRAIAAEMLRERLQPVEEKRCVQRFEKMKQLRAKRLEHWKANILDDAERGRFRELQVKWMSDPNVDVGTADARLREKFEQHVMVKTDEGTMEARNFLRDVESGDKYCKPGKFGRMFQFHDPDFPSNSFSLGLTASCRSKVKDWKQSTLINADAVIFDGGTDPDDVRRGFFKDGWLMGALAMLAAAGGVDDGDVDAQVANLFVSHVGADGQPKYNSEVGIYAVRFFKNNQWEVVTVDDFFPCMDDNDEDKDDDNKGSVVGHSQGMKEIWVALIEKAYAKYYGAYEVLDEGYVHHALKELTGAETECISLSHAARGSGKKSLWNKMVTWRRNGYILGCGSHPEHVKFAFDTGIVPDDYYTIYDVLQVDGHKLLRLRNPPGDHEEWKGDWSDKSACWTKRLKSKLGWSNEDDNTFWMCFDDFCEIYREIYVCKWFNKERWKECVVNGEWDIGGKQTVEGIEVEKENTAVGLPNVHNSGCKVENNPQYTIEVDRPTEIRLKFEQVDANGLASSIVHPVACYICKPQSSGRASRVKSLTKKNVLFSTGPPKRERNQEIYCTLQPGVYVILCGTYVAGMDGPFRISILSNYEVEEEQIWPPTWRADDPDSFAGKMALKIANKVGQAADQAAQLSEKAVAAGDKFQKDAGGLWGDGGELELTEEEKDLEAQLEKERTEGQAAARKKAMDDAYGAAGRGEL